MKTVVNINIIVFTEQLIKDYPEPSLDPSNPTRIPNSYVFLVKSGQKNAPIEGFVGESLKIKASKGLQVNFCMLSETANYDTPIIFYEMTPLKPKSNNSLLLKTFPDVKTIVPTSFNPLVCTFTNKEFWFCTGFLNKRDKSEYALNFSVYNGDNLTILGYFQLIQTLLTN